MSGFASRHGSSAQASLLAFDEIVRTIAYAGDEPVLESIVPLLRELLEGEQAIGYRFEFRDRALEIDFAFGAGIGSVDRYLRLTRAFLSRTSEQVTMYRYPTPTPEERNRVLLLATEEDRERYESSPIVRELFPLLGLRGQDQLRVLLCDGPHLLAWVGAFRLDRFGAREAERLGMVVEPLAKRLKLEERLRRLATRGAALDVAMEALGAPAFILNRWGEVAHANGAGQALSREARGRLVERAKGVLEGKRPADADLSLLRIESDGLPSHTLLVQPPGPLDVVGVDAFARKWGLTRRQSEVLRELLEGKANKVIGAALGIQESTVELHVTSLLRKLRVESRAELIAAFWSAVSR